MRDPRIEQYARLFVEQCIDVQPGWQVLIDGGVLARPLLEEICRQIARRDAYALLQVSWGGGFGGLSYAWLREASIERISEPAPIPLRLLDQVDAVIGIEAPENRRNASALDPERLNAMMAAYRPGMERIFNDDLPWTGGQYPTPALAQDAGMATDEFEDFLYGACLLDWDAERERMRRYADHFDRAEEVRVVGPETDLTLNVAGRTMVVDAGGKNIPGGEFFTSPVEDSAEGVVTFGEFPTLFFGRELRRIRLRFESGRVVDASASDNEDVLLETLDTDDGARRLGELGIGCNPGVTRYMKNTLFDEKMDGTVHLALGNGIGEAGGKNVSAIHWDIVKDLRTEGRIELDGKVAQQNGAWTI